MTFVPARAKPRLLVATDDASAGGTAQVAYQIAAALVGDFDVRLAGRRNAVNAHALDALTRQGVAFVAYDIDEGAPWRNPLKSLYSIDQAIDLLEASDPDLLLTFDSAELFSFAALKSTAKQCGIPFVAVINILLENVEARFGFGYGALVEALAKAEAIVFACEAHRRRFDTVLPDHPAPQRVILNCRPERFFTPRDRRARERLRRELQLPEDAFVCLTTARIEPHKGQHLIVRALASLQRRGLGADVRLVFAGGASEPHLRELEREIARGALEDRVLTLGPRADVVDLLDASDLFILPSKSEATSLSIIEAMAKGVPVAATAVDGILELIDEDCAILLPLDPDAAVVAIAAAIERSSKDERLRMRLAEAARERANGFRVERAAAGYASLLREIVERRRAETSERRYRRSILPTGGAVDCANPAAAWNVLQEGWSISEAEGVWSSGPSSTLLLRTSAHKGETLLIEFDISAYVSPICSCQQSYVFADDEPVAFWRILSPGRQKLSVRVEVVDDSGRVRLRFEHMRAVRPAAFGESADPRELALFLRTVTVRAAREEASRVA
ncbi:glycosyltransferase [Methylosinus sp. Sm6]|uniref:glycosyltransferase n=1 Tax=Methylosinus sp. Sm6 TaxID=2866948 RepID=UPI001C998881|nr:glycosyltransferase [Methylosinus sp. Sm6]MBY6241352.1 glycosyltransferase [Methylosinus sp. Sm6]